MLGHFENEVFICYRLDLYDLAVQLKAELEKLGVNSFVCPKEAAERTPLESLLQNEIVACPYFLLLMSPSGLGEYQQHELDHAHGLGKRIITVKGPGLSTPLPKKFPEWLRTGTEQQVVVQADFTEMPRVAAAIRAHNNGTRRASAASAAIALLCTLAALGGMGLGLSLLSDWMDQVQAELQRTSFATKAAQKRVREAGRRQQPVTMVRVQKPSKMTGEGAATSVLEERAHANGVRKPVRPLDAMDSLPPELSALKKRSR